ncbi:MAG: tRNA pseudouridine(55) synthase TruB [Gloeomargarita sp. SKYBB_i_bin120]|nr:tRNA pseudouridine(55) synthase TruB [Gloeomargarita sp. SKYB120]MDW8178847.1 tRNA pseudouridine(55) synthase TruB [Gloeomargarita sp. SKYBB_i_bin120]
MDGFINLYKPAGLTSHDCVTKIRRWLRERRVGHGGTLDPLATGVLPIAVGRATRLLTFLPADKRYRARVRFGVQTTTDDLAGELVTQQPVPDLTLATVQAVLPEFIGVIAQKPPAFSAIHIQGQRAYDLARQGQAVDLPERSVEIYELTVRDWQGGAFPELTLDVHCGSGTYIRSLARDIGQRLGIPATLSALERTASGGMDIARSLTLEQCHAHCQAGDWQLDPLDHYLHHLPAVTLTRTQAQRWCYGQPQDVTVQASPWWRVYDEQGHFLGIGQRTSEQTLKPHLVLADPRSAC